MSRSFADMANSLSEYHAQLQEKVTAATLELSEANESLLQRSRQKSDFIARLSHELRTPLTSMKGAMDYLSVKLPRRGIDDQDLVGFFEMIKRNADRLIRLVNNALDYERIDLGKFEMNFAEVNLKDAFQEIITAFKPLAEEKRASIQLRAIDATASVDADRIKQVLTKLISNALNFSSASTRILVSLEYRGKCLHAAVEDMGSGVPENERETIFEQFYTNNVKDGTGLGLAICKGIVEAHDGAIGVENVAGGGSRFWFSLPKERKERRSGEKHPTRH